MGVINNVGFVLANTVLSRFTKKAPKKLTMDDLTAPVYDIHKQFQDARVQARRAGRILAYCLALRYPFAT